MRLLAASALALLCASPIAAQVAYPPTTVDTSNLATASDLAAIIAAQPPVCSTATPKPAAAGTAGSGTACTPRVDRAAGVDVQANNTTLLANCSFTIAFPRSFVSAVPFVYAAVVDTGGAQMPCKIQSRSATGASGICNGAQSTVLSLSVVTSGLTVLPFGTTCTAGTAVMWVAREPTQ
jgi:hypothetical protein